MIEVEFLNNDGGGFAKKVQFQEGTSVGQAFAILMAGQSPGNFLIRVNRETVAAEAILKTGDRITCTPTKVDAGA